MNFARQSRVLHALIFGLVAFVGVLLLGTLGYKWIGGERASWMDALYMTFITVATIGYGEVVDLSGNNFGRLFTMFIALLGIGNLTYLFSLVTVITLESDLNQGLRRRRMEKAIQSLAGHYIVCGIGRVGRNVAAELATTGREFVVIDENNDRLTDFVARDGTRYFLVGDAADDESLIAAGIARAAGVFALAGDDHTNVVIALTAKQLNPNCRVVARVHEIKNFEKTRRAGADEIVSPDFTGGLRIASAMVRPSVVGFLDQMLRSDEGLRIEEVTVGDGAAGCLIADLHASDTRDFVLLAVRLRANSKDWRFNPAPDVVLHSGDVVVAMATRVGRQRLEQQLAAKV